MKTIKILLIVLLSLLFINCETENIPRIEAGLNIPRWLTGNYRSVYLLNSPINISNDEIYLELFNIDYLLTDNNSIVIESNDMKYVVKRGTKVFYFFKTTNEDIWFECDINNEHLSIGHYIKEL